ncbi:efflux RND transporter permease subunit, partial [Alistipes onderdonkii]
LVELHDKGQTEAVEARFNAYVRAMCPDVWLRSSLFKLSPVPDAAIEFGFIGDDIDTLRRLTQAAEEIMWRTPGTVNIRNSWGNRVPTWLPLYSQMKGQRIGVTRSQMAQGITIATQGYRLGEYREGDQFMPILLKDENIDTYNLTNLQALPIFTPAGKVYSIEQATDGFRFEYRGGVVKRYNRQRVMKAQCDPGRGVNTMRLYAALRDSVLRGVVLPEGYSMKVFGEQESQQESNSALARYMPLTMVLIFIVLLLLFRNYREPVVILLMIPLIFIGVVLGLAVTGKVFNFFSLLGLLGLVGMNIKNAVVLVGQVGVLRSEGKDAYEALTAATRSRIVPVAMASGTPLLGMRPLLFDAMFGALAATI